MSEGRFSFLAGAGLVLAAWVAGADWVTPASQPLVERLPELLAVLTVILAWRFRASRAALAAVAVALSSLLLRQGLVPLDPSTPAHALLAVVLPLNLAALAPLPDRPLMTRGPLLHLGALVLQPLVLGSLLAGGAEPAPWVVPLATPQARLGALVVAGVVILVALAVRRSATEAGLLWAALAGTTAATAVDPVRAATLLTAAAGTVLLAMIETSYRLAYHDPLTGLPGRRALDDALAQVHGDLAVAMVDVDRFKAVNDRYGHEVGDQVLRMVAAQLARVGGGGRSFRYGGEEFAIVFPGRRAADAAPYVDEVRAVIEASPFVVRAPDRPSRKPRKPASGGGRGVTVTVSAGVAASRGREADPDEVLKAADQALYRAKRAGRNRVHVR